MTVDRVAVVTGTSSGIGLWTAVGLAAAGHHVVATMRDLSRSQALRTAAEDAGVEVEIQALDVTDRAQARHCIEQVLTGAGRLDVLVNNAGRGSVDTLEQLSDSDLQEQLDVNYLSVAALTRLVLPTMRQAGHGRVVTVTSVGGVVGQPFADAYCAAKFAVEGLMQSLAPVMSRFGVGISIVEPAAVASAFVVNTGAGPAGTVDVDDPYGALRDAYLRRSAGAFSAAQPPREAAAVVVEAATTSTPRFRWQTSDGATAFAGLSLVDLDGSRVLGQTSGWLD